MCIQRVLIRHGIKPLEYDNIDNMCVFSAAKTNLRLPNGDWIDKYYFQELKEKNWLDENDNYSKDFFKANNSCFPYIDSEGHVHIVSAGYLDIAIEENNLEAYHFIKKILPKEALIDYQDPFP